MSFAWLLRYLAPSSFPPLARLPLVLALNTLCVCQARFTHGPSSVLALVAALSLGHGACGWIKHSYLWSDHSQIPPFISKSLWSKEGLERWEMVLEFELLLYMTAGDAGCWAEAYILGSIDAHEVKQTLVEARRWVFAILIKETKQQKWKGTYPRSL